MRKKKTKDGSSSQVPMQDNGLYPKVGLNDKLPFGKYWGSDVYAVLVYNPNYIFWLDDQKVDFFTDDVKEILNGEKPLQIWFKEKPEFYDNSSDGNLKDAHETIKSFKKRMKNADIDELQNIMKECELTENFEVCLLINEEIGRRNKPKAIKRNMANIWNIQCSDGEILDNSGLGYDYSAVCRKVDKLNKNKEGLVYEKVKFVKK